MLIGAEQIIQIIHSYRMCSLKGKFSGGKTSLAIKIAETYLKQGYRLVTNAKTVWDDDINEIDFINDVMHLKTVFILDEAGQWLEDSKDIKKMTAYSAKMDVIFLYPSFFPPSPAAQVVTIQVLFDLKRIGIPWTFYRWDVSLGKWRDNGVFSWFLPQEIWGVYSRQHPGVDTEDIQRFMVEKTQKFIQHYTGSRQGINQLSEVAEDEPGSIQFDHLVYALNEHSESLQALSTGKAKRRGR